MFRPSLVCFVAVLVVACGSSDASAPSPEQAGSGGSSAAGAPAAGGQSAAGTGGAATMPSGGDCTFSASGGVTVDVGDGDGVGCTNGYSNPNTSGAGYVLNVAIVSKSGGGFPTFGCFFNSATPPAAGATWTISQDDASNGKCTIDAGAQANPTEWAAIANAGMSQGSATLTFASASAIKGTYHPENTYYAFDATVTGTMVATLGAGAADIAFTAHVVQPGVPLGD